MIPSLQPREPFPISRVLQDPNDSGTYYVRAFIRKIQTNVLLDTVNLLVQGNRIYANTWTVPVDSQGRGVFISITTIVYSDSGYTTPSTVYGEEQSTYYIYDRYNFLQQLANQISALVSAPGDKGVEYGKIRKIIAEEIKKAEKPVEEVKNEPVDLSPVISAVRLGFERMAAMISGIEIPEGKDVDLMPVLQAVQAIKMPEIPAAVDYSGLFKSIQKSNEDTVKGAAAEVKMLMEGLPRVAEAMTAVKHAVITLESRIKSAVEKKLPVEEPVSKRRPSLNRFGRVAITK